MNRPTITMKRLYIKMPAGLQLLLEPGDIGINYRVLDSSGSRLAGGYYPTTNAAWDGIWPHIPPERRVTLNEWLNEVNP